jgi:hypothetical protein
MRRVRDEVLRRCFGAGAIACLVACGRIRFGELGDGGSGHLGDGAGAIMSNIAFVTGDNVAAGSLGGLAAADARCMADAAAAQLAGTYVAWLSTSTVDARARLGSARGWQRPDGVPYADTVAELAANGPYSISLYGANGAEIDNGISTLVTGTSASGTYAGAACADYTSTTATAEVGSIYATGSSFTATAVAAAVCNGGAHLLCLGVDHAIAVMPPGPPSSASFRRAFVTTGTWLPGGGLASADAMCQNEANANNLGSTFQAMLATDTTAPLSRFAPGLPWARLDGVAIADSYTSLGTLPYRQPINLTAAGSYLSGATVWSGTSSFTGTSSGNTCTSWTASGANRRGVSGSVDFGDLNGLATGLATCSVAQHLYCFEL